MGYQLWLADVLADAFRGVKGFRVEAYPGWEMRGREDFEPRGLLDHHTGGGGTFDNIVHYMMEVSSLKPSCNWATSAPINGVVRIMVTAAGRANHAGKGRYAWVPENQGNKYLIGGEHHNDGYTRWPAQQVEGIHRADAAMLKHLGLGADRVIFHKSYAGYRGKWDMHTLELGAHQQSVKQYFNSVTPTIDLEDPMANDIYMMHVVYLGAEPNPSSWSKALIESFNYHFWRALNGTSMEMIRQDFQKTAKDGGRM